MSGDAPDASRVAVISCVHGNLEALTAVLRDIEEQPEIDDIVCLGDLVGYGPCPNEVVEVIAAREITTVLGCWDEGIGHEHPSCGCAFVSEHEGELGARAFQWTQGEVYTETRERLRALPFALRHDMACGKVLFVHGSPTSTSEYLTESTHELVLLERAARGECDILVCGHTHVPFVKTVAGALDVRIGATLKEPVYRAAHPSPAPPPSTFQLRPKTIVNAGSVGEPRHGGLEATYVILDGRTGDVEIRSVAYDLDMTLKAMTDKGIDRVFIERLRDGAELTGKRKEVSCAC